MCRWKGQLDEMKKVSSNINPEYEDYICPVCHGFNIIEVRLGED
jgi:hypothetical protein